MQDRQSLRTSGDFVDLRDYLAVLRRRALVIVVLTALGLGLALGYSKLQTPIYTATTSVLINPPAGTTMQNPNNVISVDTEAQVVRSAPIAGSAAKLLGSPLTIPQLLKHVSVKTTAGTFILAISYRDPQPARAAAGANAFARAYLDYKRQQGEDQITQLQTSIQSQLTELRRQQAEQNRILAQSEPGTIAYRNARDALSQLDTRLTVLASSLVQLPQIVNPGQILLPAAPPRSPSSPKVPMNAAIGLLFGLALGTVTAFVLDRMDDRVRRGVDLALYIDAPVLAYVPHVKGRRRERAAQLVVHREPRTPVAEAYRTIRTGVLSMARTRDMKVFAVVSPMQREGKSMTSANLAAALGQTDERVLVVSADIRRPGVHEFFGVANGRGLSELLEGEISTAEAIQSSEVGNVWVLPGGRFPAGPAELLQSPRMADLLAAARLQFDFVIVDCPPVLGLADSLAVLPLVDAVLLVVQTGKTRGGAILEVSDHLDRVGCSVDAVVMNDVHVSHGRPGHHAYGYYLASKDYLRPPEAEPPAPVEERVPPATTKDTPSPALPRFAPPRPVSSISAGNGAAKKGASRGAKPEAKKPGDPHPATSSADDA